MFIASCMRMFFIFNIYTHVSAENIISKPDWKLALQKIDELQKIVITQDERISILEKRPTEESEVQTVTELQNIVKKQGDKIAQLKARIQELETIVKVEEVIPVETLGNGQFYETNGNSVTSNKTYSRRGTFQFSYIYINSSSSKTSLKSFFKWF